MNPLLRLKLERALPQVRPQFRLCDWCRLRQDALACKQRAEQASIFWRCRGCRHLNRWTYPEHDLSY